MKMILIKYVSAVFLASVVLCACKNTDDSEPQAMETIDYANASIKSMADIPDSLLGYRKYIFLDNETKSTFVSAITKVSLADGRIFVLDPKLSKVVVFDESGKGIGQVGSRGQGEGEYIGISDFCLSDAGDIYLLDGVQKKLLVFDKQLIFKSARKLPFDAEALRMLQNGHILWGLCSWNSGECSGRKMAVTDKDLNVLEDLADYSDYTDPSYQFAPTKIIETAVGLVYNKENDNHIYQLDKKGKMLQTLLFDFGKYSVPDEQKKNVEKHLADYRRYCLLKGFVAVTDRIVAGQFRKFGQTVPFIFDRRHQVCYEGEPSEIPTYTSATDYDHSYWITYLESLDSAPSSVPDAVRDYLKEEGMVLCLQKLE